jgi:hypothetical protein
LIYLKPSKLTFFICPSPDPAVPFSSSTAGGGSVHLSRCAGPLALAWSENPGPPATIPPARIASGVLT